MASIEELTAAHGLGDTPEPVIPALETPEPPGAGIRFDFSFLMTQTGDGTIEMRLDHPLNPGRSMGLAQALRGFDGFFGNNTKLAVMDIVFGVMTYMRERRAASGGSKTAYIIPGEAHGGIRHYPRGEDV